MKASTTMSILAVALFLAVHLLHPLPSMAAEGTASLDSSEDPDGGCIASAETKSGTISPGADTDSFTFYGQAGQGVVIEMPRISGHLYPRLQLYDPNALRVASDESWPSTRASVENYQLQMTGIYTIVASNDHPYGLTGEYGLSLVLAPGTTISQQDPDGGDIASDETKTGKIFPAGDTDAYCFYGLSGQRIVIEMARISGGLYPRLQLYDPNGVRATSHEPWPSTRASIEGYELQMTGIYTIVASNDYPYGLTGEYGLSLSLIPPSDPRGLCPYDPLPLNGQTLSLCDWDTLSLSCWPVETATNYDVYFARGPCDPLQKVAENIPDPCVPTLALPALENKHHLCSWKVIAHTPEGDIQGPTWSFLLECCFPSDFTTFSDWVALGKPDCWCSGYKYQCDGDCDGETQGFQKYRVFTNDLACLIKNWKKPITDPSFNPSCDFDHKPESFHKYRCFTNDLRILIANWKKTDADLPGDCPRPE